MANKTLPPLPRSLYFPTGRVTVRRKKGLMESQQAFGIFNWAKRTIEIDSELEPHAAHLTLFHEAMHVILMDAGIQMDEVMEERLCDTYAAHRVAEMLK